MREKIFRGLTVATKPEWVYGHYVCLSGVCNQHRIFPFGCSLHGSVAVYGETVGQFTGKIDKKGNKIFEHDRVLRSIHGSITEGNVYWSHGQWQVSDINGGNSAHLFDVSILEVIGTIHDEMVKEEK